MNADAVFLNMLGILMMLLSLITFALKERRLALIYAILAELCFLSVAMKGEPKHKEVTEVLIFTRREGEAFNIGENIRVVIVNVGRGLVQVGIDAPKEIPVHREEVLRKIKAAERKKKSEEEKRLIA